MDRGAWWATGHGVAKESDTTEQLSTAHTQSRIKCSQTIPPEGTLLPSRTSRFIYFVGHLSHPTRMEMLRTQEISSVFFTDVSQNLDVCLTQSEHFLSIKNCPKMNEILKTMGIKPNNV